MIGDFWETAYLPLPWLNVNTNSSLRAKCWLREGVGRQFSRNLSRFFLGNDKLVVHVFVVIFMYFSAVVAETLVCKYSNYWLCKNTKNRPITCTEVLFTEDLFCIIGKNSLRRHVNNRNSKKIYIGDYVNTWST